MKRNTDKMPTNRVRCVSDRYDANGATYDNVHEFSKMCRDIFDDIPLLVERNGPRGFGWYEGDVLILVRA